MKENPVSSLLWFCYYFIGAVHYRPEVSTIYRYIHRSISAFIALFTTIGPIGYILTVESPDILSVVCGMAVMAGAVYMNIIPPLSTYLYRKELITIIRYIESYRTREFNCNWSMRNFKKNHQRNRWKPKYNTVSYILKQYTIVVLLLMPLAVFPPILGTMLFHSQQHVYREARFHILLIPFMNDLSSYKTYLLIYILEGVVFLVGISYAMIQLAFLQIVTCELSNIIHYQCHLIKNLSYIINDKFDEEFSLSLNDSEVNVSIGNLNTIHNHGEVKELIQQSFIEIIQLHQHFVRVTKPFCSFVAIYGTVSLQIVVFTLICVVFVLLNSDAAFEVKGKCVALLPIIMCYFYTFCELGTMFAEMNEELLLELYCLPWWYRFSKEFRILVHIWQGEMSCMPNIKAFNTYVLERQFFPSILKYVYSIANILRNST